MKFFTTTIAVAMIILASRAYAAPPDDLDAKLEALQNENAALKKMMKIEALERENASLRKQVTGSSAITPSPAPSISRHIPPPAHPLAVEAFAYATPQTYQKAPGQNGHAVPVIAPLWSGFYVGFNGGYGQGADAVSFSPGNPVSSFPLVPGSLNKRPVGGLAGMQIGYNWQPSRNSVVGIESDLDWGRIAGSAGVSNSQTFQLLSLQETTSAQQKLTALGTVRTRLGYVFADRLLVFATGGLAYGYTELDTSATLIVQVNNCPVAGPCPTFWNSASSKQWQMGWTAGLGTEWAFAEAWSIKAEYLHYDLGSFNQDMPTNPPASPNTVLNSSATFKGDIVRVGINAKLN